MPSTPRSSLPQDQLRASGAPGPPDPYDTVSARPTRRVVGVVLLVLALVLTGVTLYRSAAPGSTTVAFSRNEVLASLWQKYAQAYIEPGSGRVLDRQQNDLTTSEGQSYAMLRAVWQDDRETFDRVWTFTRDVLDRPDDHLFAWKFGQRPDGSYGVLEEQGGQNTASDADTDIALALVMAYGRWQESSYLKQAQPIISDIWVKEVVQVQGRPVLAGNDLERKSQQVIVNPSYFAPYAYRIFARVDTAHDWPALVTSSYDLIERSLDAPLDRGRSIGLPPNWLRIDRLTGEFLPLSGGLNSDFGYDALRLPWRLALDHEWNDEPRAQKALERMSFLGEQWRNGSRLAATYAHDGSNPAGYESPALYGGALGYFAVVDPAQEAALYDSKLASLYDPDTQSWRTPLSYYDDNWAWFGMALRLDALPDLAEGVTA